MGGRRRRSSSSSDFLGCISRGMLCRACVLLGHLRFSKLPSSVPRAPRLPREGTSNFLFIMPLLRGILCRACARLGCVRPCTRPSAFTRAPRLPREGTSNFLFIMPRLPREGTSNFLFIMPLLRGILCRACARLGHLRFSKLPSSVPRAPRLPRNYAPKSCISRGMLCPRLRFPFAHNSPPAVSQDAAGGFYLILLFSRRAAAGRGRAARAALRHPVRTAHPRRRRTASACARGTYDMPTVPRRRQ